MSIRKKEWFESWFDSPYYHILYKDRDEKEASLLLDNLIRFLNPEPGARILDVACGKGRHAIYLHSKGYRVTGFDLSKESIEFNKKHKGETLSFFVHDMREIFLKGEFDIVFNLFSSFGYFDDHSDNEKVICANATALKEEGALVIDYMNSKKIARNLVPEDVKECKGIRFLQMRKIDSGKIVKKISFTCGAEEFRFEEHLQLYTLEDFQKMFSKNNLLLTHTFGDYHLNAFDEKNSDRLILVAKKKFPDHKNIT